MDTDLIQLNVQSGIATLHLNRPEKYNAMNDALRAELVRALEGIAADRGIRALVLTGNGKAFCAGGDVAAMAARLETPVGDVGFNGWSRQQHIHHAQSLLCDLAIPTVAAVNGAAVGLGADVALACDFVIASSEASFAWSYIHRGLVADGGGMYLLPRRVGLPRAKALIFGGRKVRAEEALALGIADHVCAPEALLSEAEAWAREFSAGSRTALALGKSILNQSFELSSAAVAALGSQAQGICYASTEHRESVVAFLEKSDARRAQAGS